MMTTMHEITPPFSERFGFHGPDAEITIREAAPSEVRDTVLMLGYRSGLGPDGMRELLCELLLKRPDRGNWSPENVRGEVSGLADDAPWPKIYDLAERLYAKIGESDYTGQRQAQYASALNRSFRELGVGWELQNDALVARGSKAFTLATGDATEVMRASGRQRPPMRFARRWSTSRAVRRPISSVPSSTPWLRWNASRAKSTAAPIRWARSSSAFRCRRLSTVRCTASGASRPSRGVISRRAVSRGSRKRSSS